MIRTLIIGQAPVSILRSWKVAEKLGARTTFSATVILSEIPELYQKVMLVDGAVEGKVLSRLNTVFDGIITKVRPFTAGRDVYYEISAVDHSRIAEYRLCSFAVTNKLAGDIIRERLLPLLAADGITAGAIADGVLVKKAVFNFTTVAEALTKLATLCGGDFYWQISGKRLTFGVRSSRLSATKLDGQIPYNGLAYTASADNYRNVQYIKGAQGRTSPQTETLSADGDEYSTRYPIAQDPVIYVGGEAATVGVSGLSSSENVDFTWSYESRTIKCNLETVPASITVNYIGLMTIYTRMANNLEISRVQRASGGSGIRENIYSDDNIDTMEGAVQYCDALLQKYAKDAEKISFELEDDLWKVGDLVEVDLPEYRALGPYLVTERTISAANAISMRYAYVLSGGSDYNGWVEFFAQLAARPTGSLIDPDEIATVLQAVNECVTEGGSYDIAICNTPVCADTLICSNELVLGSIISQTTIGG